MDDRSRESRRLSVRTLVIVAAASYLIGIVSLTQQAWSIVIPATLLFQLALVGCVATRAGGDRTARQRVRGSRVTGVRADAWLLAEALCDLSATRRPPGAETGARAPFAVVSRRNSAPLEFFPTEEDARQAMGEVTRHRPHLDGRFVITAAGGEGIRLQG